MTDLLYLDHNATTPVLPEAQAAVANALANCFGNPSSSHAAGRAARKVVEEARKTIAELVDADRGSQVIFVSGATEGINQVIASAPPGRLITTALEHPAVHAAAARRDDLTVELVESHAKCGVDFLRHGRQRI